MKLPNPDKSEIFIMRISKKDKQKLLELSSMEQFENNQSEVIRQLITKLYKILVENLLQLLKK